MLKSDCADNTVIGYYQNIYGEQRPGWYFAPAQDKLILRVLRVRRHFFASQGLHSPQNYLILQNVWLESKGPDNTLRMRSIIWICVFCEGIFAWRSLYDSVTVEYFVIIATVNIRLCGFAGRYEALQLFVYALYMPCSHIDSWRGS